MSIPSLPDRPPDRFQFHLKELLAFMFASAMVAFGIRLALDYVGQLPPGYLPGWLNVGLSAVSLGGLAYFFLRLPFVAVGVSRVSRRWRTVQSHRRELAEWAKTRRSKPARIMEGSGESRGHSGE